MCAPRLHHHRVHDEAGDDGPVRVRANHRLVDQLFHDDDHALRGESGINWGWSAREGFHRYKGGRPAGARDPIFEGAHTSGYCAIVGGYVYRGRAIPALRGVYLYGARAGGPAASDADVETIIVLDRVDHYGAELEKTSQLCASLSHEFRVLVSRVFVAEETWEGGPDGTLPALRTEAVAL